MLCSRFVLTLIVIIFVLITIDAYGAEAHTHKHRSRSRNRPPTHSAQPLVAEHPSGTSNGANSGSNGGPECDYLTFKQGGCEDEHGSQCNSSTGKCECKSTHPIRLLDFCLPVSRLNGPCYTSGQCANVLNASCYIFGKEYDLETASGGHNLGRQVRNWPLGVCKCRLGFAFNESMGICEKRLVGSWCSNDKHCLLRSLNSICDKKKGECECSWGTAYEANLDACVPSPIKPQIGKTSSSASNGNGKSKELGTFVSSPPPIIVSYKSLYMSRCETDADCEPSNVNDRQPTTSRLYQKPINNTNVMSTAHGTKKSEILTISASSSKNSKSSRTTKNNRLQCVRNKCICPTTYVWESGGCKEDWIAESEENSSINRTHHGRNRNEDTQENEMDEDNSISWQTVTCMAIFSLFFAGITFRACYYRKSEEDELAEDLRTAEALFAHKNVMGPQHPFNALTAAFLSKPAPGPPVNGGCSAGHKPPYGYHGPTGCYHHEPYGYNYGRCAATGPVMNSAPYMPPPLNEQDEDEYLRQEAAEQENAEKEHVQNKMSDEANSAEVNDCDKPEIEKCEGSESNSLNEDNNACSQQMNNCGANGCCGCECMLVVNHGTSGPMINDCCAGAMAPACSSATCPGIKNPLTREQELAQELAEMEAEQRKKSLQAKQDEEENEEIISDEQDDDEKVAILRTNGINSNNGTGSGLSAGLGSGLGNMVGASTSSAGALGRTICSTAAGLVMSQLTNSSNTRTDRKTSRRTSSCSSSSASLLNWSSSSSSESAPGTANGPEVTNSANTPAQSGGVETVHLLVFSGPQPTSST